MTIPPCATGCGRPSPSAVICGDCCGELRRALELAASISGALEDAVARQSAHGGTGRASGSENPLPIDLGAMAARDALRDCLAGWVAVVGEVHPHARWPWHDGTVRGMALWLRDQMRTIASHDAAPDIHGEVRDAVARAARVLDPPPERHPAGDCTMCGRQLYAEPGADVAHCACGATMTGIIAMRARRAAEADVLGDSEAISRALASLGIRVSGGVIRMWSSRQRLPQRPGGVYAMSDVLVLIAERDARR